MHHLEGKKQWSWGTVNFWEFLFSKGSTKAPRGSVRDCWLLFSFIDLERGFHRWPLGPANPVIHFLRESRERNRSDGNYWYTFVFFSFNRIGLFRRRGFDRCSRTVTLNWKFFCSTLVPMNDYASFVIGWIGFSMSFWWVRVGGKTGIGDTTFTVDCKTKR